MAHANKRTSIVLTGLAVAFVVVIIILCVIPRPCKPPNCGTVQEHSKNPVIEPGGVITDTTTTSTTPSTTTSTTPSTTLGIPSTTTSTTPSTSTTSSSTSTTSSSTILPETITEVGDEVTSTTSSTSSSTTSSSIISSFSPTAPSSSSSTTSTSSTDSKEDVEKTDNVTSIISTSSTTTQDNIVDPDYSPESTTATSTTTSTTPESATASTPPASTTTSTTPASTTTSTTPASTTTSTTPASTTTSTTPASTTTSSTPASTTPSPSPASATTSTMPPHPEDSDVCQTPPCRRMAARMLDLMDNGHVDPCENFYQYSCGGVTDAPFLKPQDRQHFTKNVISDALKKLDTSDPLLGPLKTYYDSCLNHINTNATLRKDNFETIFQSTGYRFNPKVLNKTLEGNTDFDLTDTLAKMMKMQFTPFFDILLEVDDQNPESFVFKLTPPLSMPRLSDGLAKAVCLRNYHKELEQAKQQGDSFNINEAYANFTLCMKNGTGLHMLLLKMEEAVNTMGLMEDIEDEDFRKRILREIAINTNFFLAEIAQDLPDVPALRNKHLKKDYGRRLTLREFYDSNLASDVVNWETLIKSLTEDSVNADNFYIHVYFPDQLRSILTKLETEMSFGPLNLQNMLLLMWSEHLYTNLVDPVDNTLSSPDYCYRAATNLLEDSTSLLYMKNVPDRDNKIRQLDIMIKNNTQAAILLLEKRNNPSEIHQLITKLNKMNGKMPSENTAEEIVNKHMTVIPVFLEADNFLMNSKILLERHRTLMYQNIKDYPAEDVILWSHFLLPHSPSGVVSYALNKFFIPLGAMEVPLYRPDIPSYLNSAGLGHMIAHELMHGFDSTGIEHDGSIKNTMIAPRDFQQNSECLAGGVSDIDFTHQSGNSNMIFQLTKDQVLNELLSDSGATRLAWEAYLTKFLPAAPRQHIPPLIDEPEIPMRRRRSLLWYPTPPEESQRRKRQAGGLFPDDPSALFPDTTNSYVHTLPSMETTEQRLPYLELEPIQLYFLQFAQSHCSATSELDMLDIMEGEHLPPHLRVNMVLQNDPLFAAAFNCPAGAPMRKETQCPFLLK